jgi:RNA polymerase sigma factor (sigma-70 family)
MARYRTKVYRVVRRRLPTVLRRKFDSGDFFQMVWASMLKNPSQLRHFKQSRAFGTYLAAVAANKVKMEIRRRFCLQKHNMIREVPLRDDELQLVAKDPRPSQVLSACDQLSRELEVHPAYYRRVLEMRVAGLTTREIAANLGLDNGAVRRALRTLMNAVKS